MNINLPGLLNIGIVLVSIFHIGLFVREMRMLDQMKRDHEARMEKWNGTSQRA